MSNTIDRKRKEDNGRVEEQERERDERVEINGREMERKRNREQSWMLPRRFLLARLAIRRVAELCHPCLQNSRKATSYNVGPDPYNCRVSQSVIQSFSHTHSLLPLYWTTS